MTESDRPRSDETAIIETVLAEAPDAPVVANLGVASWMLARVADRKRNFYMDGGMGGTTPTGMGIALQTTDDVVVLEGDGSLLMSLGCLSTVGSYGPDNLVIVVMDNGVYGTTGGQETASSTVDFVGVAENCGVRSYGSATVEEFEAAFREALDHDGPALIACRVEPEIVGPPDDFVAYEKSHSYVSDRFRAALDSD